MTGAVLFDLDGTLLYTLEDLANAVNHVLKEHGFPEHSIEKVESFIGNGVRVLMQRALPEGKKTPGFEKLLAEFREYYKDHILETTLPYEGIEELLKELKQRGIKTGVVTNKFQAAAEKLIKVFFGDLIDVTVGSSDNMPVKPATDMPVAAARKLMVPKSEILYVGDTAVDAETAVNAGLSYVLVLWGYGSRESLEEASAKGLGLCSEPADILRYIDA